MNTSSLARGFHYFLFFLLQVWRLDRMFQAGLHITYCFRPVRKLVNGKTGKTV